MTHGSSVTYTVQSVSRHASSTSAARFIARNSACPAGSFVVSRRLHARAMTCGFSNERRVAGSMGSYTTTAPMGTSPSRSARRASSMAIRM